jgi:hypothetical protein
VPAGSRIGFGGDARSFVTSPAGVVAVTGSPVPEESEPAEAGAPRWNDDEIALPVLEPLPVEAAAR